MTPPPFTPAAAARLLAITEAAAIAQSDAPGLPATEEGTEAAAILAMHRELSAAGLAGRLVAGKGLGRSLTRLFTGEELPGDGRLPPLDLAADPLEGTSYAHAAGERSGGAVAVLAAAPAGSFLDPGPAFYMEKLVAPPAAAGRVDPAAPLARRLAQLAAALDRPVAALRIGVLEKPRHRALLSDLRRAGVAPQLSPAGDVALALQAALPEGPLDALIGTGGIAEGILAAAAVRALGGLFHWRYDPQLQSEKLALSRAAVDCRRWRDLAELAAAPQALFLATGIRDGCWLSGVSHAPGWLATESFLLTGPGGERQTIRRVRPWPPAPSEEATS